MAIANRHRPTALALSRQNLPILDRSRYASAEGLKQGAYILNPTRDRPHLILMATGSELALVVAAAEILAKSGILARVVSMPCWELFEEQSGVVSAGRPSPVHYQAARRRGRRVVRLAPVDRVGRRHRSLSITSGPRRPPSSSSPSSGSSVEQVVARARALLGEAAPVAGRRTSPGRSMQRLRGRQLVAVRRGRDLESVDDAGQEREVVRGSRQLHQPRPCRVGS